MLEFGVSGALYNSNVLMYDNKHKGLWSQLGMHALSEPLAGTALEMLPVEVVSFAAFKKAHRGAKIVSKDTGHNRDYTKSPYESYFKNENLMVPVAGVGDALPRKTLGVGIAFGEGDTARAWFVPVSAIGDARTIETPAGAGKTEGVFIVHCRTPRAAAHQPEGLAESSRGVERGVRAERHPRSRSRGRMQAEGLLAASIPRRARAALGAAENQRQRGEWGPLSGGVAALHAPATDVQAFGLERGITPLRLAEAKRETATAVRDA